MGGYGTLPLTNATYSCELPEIYVIVRYARVDRMMISPILR